MLELGPPSPDLAEPCGDHDQATYAGIRALLDRLEDMLRRNDDEGQIDRLRDVLDAGVRLDRVHDLGIGVDRIERSAVSGVEEVPEQRVADRAHPSRRADDGDRAREEQRQDRGRNSPFLTLLGGLERVFRERHREIDREDPVVHRPTQGIAGVPEDSHHLDVLGQHERPE